MDSQSISRQRRAWSRALSHRARPSLVRIEISGSSLFADQVIEVPPILAVVGRHGAGKTALFRLLEAAFGVPRSRQDRGFGLREDPYGMDGQARIALEADGQVLERTVDLTATVVQREAVWADVTPAPWPELVSFADAHRDLAMVNQMYPFEDGVLDGQGLDLLYTYRRQDLDVANLVLGREFTSLTSYLVDKLDPFFMGTARNVEVHNSSMSAGEFWFHYLAGYVFRLDNSTVGPVMIDEPEMGISQRSHRALIDELVRLSLVRDAQLIVATHAPEIAARFPLDAVRAAVPTARGIRYVTPTTRHELDGILGVSTPVRAVLVVEDDFARELITTLCELYDQHWVNSVEILRAGGHGPARATCRVMSDALSFASAVVLDGDQRDAPENTGAELFLPGTRPPESELVELARRRPDELSTLLSRSTSAFDIAVAETDGLPHQRVLDTFASSLRVSRPALVRALVQNWITDVSIDDQCRSLVSAVSALVDARR